MADLWVEERGDGAPVLFVAGLGQAAWTWRYVAPAVAEHRRTIVFDPPGTGRTPGPPRTTIAQMAEDAAAILDGRHADVVGLSMGGYVSLTLALQRPELVRSLVLAGTGAGGADRVPRPRAIADAFNEALALPYAEFTRVTLPLAFAPGWADANRERFEEIVAARLEHPATYETVEAHAAACYAYYDAGIEAERIAVPALVVHGDRDNIIPVENGRILASRLPNAEVVELPGRGHNLPLEEPKTFTRLLLDFLARAAAPAGRTAR